MQNLFPNGKKKITIKNNTFGPAMASTGIMRYSMQHVFEQDT